MPVQTKPSKIILSEPGDWPEFQDQGNPFPFYADPCIISSDSIYRGMRIYHTKTVLRNLDLRGPSDREYNMMADQDPEMAEQMRDYFIFTGVLRDVRAGWRGKFKASYIESPEVRIIPGHRPLISGREKRIILPPQGWFRTEELLQSRTGLPQITYTELPDGPCAHFLVREGQEIAVLRGRNYRKRDSERTEFAVTVYYDPMAIISHLGFLAVSDRKPRPPKEKPL